MTTCRYLNRHGNQCSGEAVDPDGEILLCTRHLAAALELIEARKRELGAAARPMRLVPTETAAAALGVPEATVRTWAARGLLKRHGSAGRALYDLGECKRLKDARAMTRRANTGT